MYFNVNHAINVHILKIFRQQNVYHKNVLHAKTILIFFIVQIAKIIDIVNAKLKNFINVQFANSNA